jgi:16S rRNA processing protein RimM
VAVEVLTDFPERFDTMQETYLGDEFQAQPRQVLSTRWHKDRVLIQFEGCTDRTTAEELRGLLLEIPIEEATPLPENEYYPHQLVGLDVLTVDGEDLGRVSDVLFTKANEVYVVTGPRGQILLPAIAEVIEKVDLDAGHMVVRLMEGLI